jgi:hypothetical protein
MRLLPRRRDVADGERQVDQLCWAWRTACVGSGLCSVVNTHRPPPGAADVRQRSMRPPPDVMGGVPGKHPAQMSLAEDQHPVGDLGPHCQDEPFGENSSPADTATES